MSLAPNSKLTPEQWRSIRTAYEHTAEPITKLAKRYGIRRETVHAKAKAGKWERFDQAQHRKPPANVKAAEFDKYLTRAKDNGDVLQETWNRGVKTIDQWSPPLDMPEDQVLKAQDMATLEGVLKDIEHGSPLHIAMDSAGLTHPEAINAVNYYVWDWPHRLKMVLAERFKAYIKPIDRAARGGDPKAAMMLLEKLPESRDTFKDAKESTQTINIAIGF